MTSFASRISGVAMLALAALPFVALPASALAAPQATVKVSDINLLTSEGMAKFHQRADYAARDFCREERSLSAASHCRAAVKAEFADKVSVVRAARLEQASQTFAAR